MCFTSNKKQREYLSETYFGELFSYKDGGESWETYKVTKDHCNKFTVSLNWSHKVTNHKGYYIFLKKYTDIQYNMIKTRYFNLIFTYNNHIMLIWKILYYFLHFRNCFMLHSFPNYFILEGKDLNALRTKKNLLTSCHFMNI